MKSDTVLHYCPDACTSGSINNNCFKGLGTGTSVSWQTANGAPWPADSNGYRFVSDGTDRGWVQVCKLAGTC